MLSENKLGCCFICYPILGIMFNFLIMDLSMLLGASSRDDTLIVFTMIMLDLGILSDLSLIFPVQMCLKMFVLFTARKSMVYCNVIYVLGHATIGFYICPKVCSWVS